MADPANKPNSNTKQQVAPNPIRPRRGRWFRRFLFLLVPIGLIGGFAPMIVSTPQVRDALCKLLVPPSKGQLQFGELTLNWMSPINVKDFHLIDEDGTHLIEVAQVSSAEPLWMLASQLGMRGTFKVVDPVVRVSVTNNDSNVERFLARFFGRLDVERPQSATGNKPGWSIVPAAEHTIEIENARIEFEHKGNNLQSKIQPIAARLATKNGVVDEFDFAIGTPPAPGGEATATDWLIARYGRDLQPEATSKNDVRKTVLRASHFKLDCLAPLLPRVSPNAELDGELDADSTIAMNPSTSGIEWDWNGTVSIQKFVIAGFEAMKKDRLTLSQISLTGQTATTLGRLAMHDVKLSTDIGELTATGDVPLDHQSQKSTLELLQSLLSDEDYHIDGHIDLKKLAAVLPQTLRIRDGIEITGGEVKVEFVGAAVDGVRRWSGNAGIVGLTANNRGQRIPWDKPLVARLNAHRNGDSIVVDALDCKSDFLRVSGKGTLEDAQFAATGDLSNLLSNIERFVDLGIDHLSGQLKASGEIRRQNQDLVTMTSKVVLDNFSYVVKQNEVWREQHLELSVDATGQVDSKPSLKRIATGEIHLQSGNDALDFILQNPVDLTSSTAGYSANAKLKGNLASWQARLQPFISVDGWRMTGDISLSTALAADARQIDVSQLTLSLKQLEAIGPEWLIQDPEIQLVTAGNWDIPNQKWVSPNLNLKGDAVSIEIHNFEMGLGREGIASLIGIATYRADLTKVSRWKNLAIPNPSHYLIGSLTGTGEITRQDSGLIGNLDAQVEKFILAGLGTGASGQTEWIALWKEPQLKLSGKGRYDTSSDKLTLDASRIDIVGLSVGATGRLEECSTRQRIELTGDLTYDWDQLMKRLGPQIGKTIQLTGKDYRPFSIKGSLAGSSTGSPSSLSIPAATVSFQPAVDQTANNPVTTSPEGLTDLAGQASVGWTTANIYGIAAGAGDLTAQMDQGICRFTPLDLVVSDGKLHVTPTIYFDRNPFVLVLPQEKLIDNVSLTPEICSNSLKLVLPMLADSAQVDGKFSVDLQGANLPLVAPTTGVADGILSIHQAQARPGSAALQLVAAIDQVRSIISRQQRGVTNRNQTLIEMPEQQVPFKLEQGRVYHQGMTFMVSNVSVKTSGSVGVIDTTLNLIAEIPIKDEWIGNNRTLAGLKGKSLKIPVVGTTSRPQIDPSVFANLAQQIGGSAIEGVLQDKVGNGLNDVINNGLDNLLRGKK